MLRRSRSIVATMSQRKPTFCICDILVSISSQVEQICVRISYQHMILHDQLLILMLEMLEMPNSINLNNLLIDELYGSTKL
jgi:hypothetical protein